VTGPSMAELIAGWAPGPVETTDTITAGPALALAGLLDTEPAVTGPGDPIPPLWHWLYFLDRPATRELGPDGHPEAGRFMPPLPQRRRMFAGGRVSYHHPIRCGDEVTRRSELAGTAIRPGRTGELLFVTVRSVFSRAGATIATEEQDVVYRSGPPATAARVQPPATPPPAAAPWQLRTVADPVLLFRFSALTYNAHRIHYDAGYATTVEGHPGLVVHGPLLALLCLELPRRHRPHQAVTKLSFRARAPLYAGQPCAVTGGPRDQGCTMRAAAPDGTAVLTAEGEFTS
jgi:3-methylfumaryl-CoA hydratase